MRTHPREQEAPPAASSPGVPSLIPRAVPPLVVALVLLAVTAPVWTGTAEFIWDARDQYFPSFTYSAHALREGRLPVWDPFSVCGVPFHADPQTGFTLNPVSMFLAVTVDPPSRGYSLLWMLTWLAGALGAYRLARAIGASPPGAAYAGIAYGLSGYWIGHGSHFLFLIVASTLPWAVALAHEAVARRSLARAFVAGVAFGTGTWGGYPGLVIFAGLALASWLVLAFLLPRGKDEEPLLVRAGWVFAVLAVVGVAALAMWSPTLYAFFREGRGYTERTGPLPRELATHDGAFTLRAAASLFFPFLNIAGRSGFTADITMNDAYLGALTVPLAVAWVGSAPRRRMWLAIFVAFAFLLSLGAAGGVRSLLYDLVPPTRYTRHNGAFRLFWMLGLSAAAGASVSLLVEDVRARRLSVWTGFAWAALAVPVALSVAAWLRSLGVDAGALATDLFVPGAVALVAGAALLAAWPTRLGRAAAWIPVALVAGDQAWHVHTNAGTTWMPGAGIVRLVEAQPPPPAEFTGRLREPMAGSMNVQQILRIPIVGGYIPLTSTDFAALASSRFREVLATTRFWLAPGVLPPARALERLQQVGAGEPVPVFAREGAGPQAAPVVPGSYGAAWIIRYGEDRVELGIDVPPAGGWLASTERFSTGWRASIDGVPVDVERVNVVFRGHPVPPGRHVVTWALDPGAWFTLVRLSWAVFAAGLVTALALAWPRGPRGILPSVARE